MKNTSNTRTQGFTLIEVMVALIVLAVGLLGMASLTVRSQQSNESAYARSQASLLAADILERMRANKVDLSTLETRKVSFATKGNAYVLTGLPSCATPTTGTPAVGTEQAAQDLAQWCASVRNSLPGVNAAQTRISRSGNIYEIVITWQEPDGSGDITVVAEL